MKEGQPLTFWEAKLLGFVCLLSSDRVPGLLEDECTYWHGRKGLTRFHELKFVDLMQSQRSGSFLSLHLTNYSCVRLKLVMNESSVKKP